jgi:diguanylate cyclase (GGDEF)-like protein
MEKKGAQKPEGGLPGAGLLHRAATRLDSALSISHKLALFFLAMAALVSLLFTWGVYRTRAGQLDADLEERGSLIARTMEGLIDEGASDAELQEKLTALASERTDILAVELYDVDADGATTIASSNATNDGRTLPREAGADVRESLTAGSVVRATEVTGEGAVVAYVPVDFGLEDEVVMGVSLSTAARDAELHDLLVSQLVSVGIALVLIPVIVYIPLRVFLFRRLRRLLATADRLGIGDFAARVPGPLPPNSRDEMMVLSTRFNDMAGSLEEVHRELSEMATTDALSGLYNRRYVFDALEREIRLARRRGLPLAIVLMDVDGLKKLNDQYGHAIGDEALKRAAGALRNALRTTDIAARIGGDEFLALLSDCDGESLRLILARIQESMQPLGLPQMPAPIRLTMSAGAAVLVSGDSSTTLMQRADLALYDAKRSGKAQSRVAA